MKLAFYFAKRYFFSKKSVHAINIISAISVVGVLVSSASLIAILSFYNGLENLILSMFSSVASEIRIEPVRGKVFDPEDPRIVNLASHPAIATLEPVLEEKVLLQVGDNQFIGRLKGVADSYTQLWKTDSLLYHGDFRLWDTPPPPAPSEFSGTANQQDPLVPLAVIGQAVSQSLRVTQRLEHDPLRVFSPRKGVINAVNPADEFIARDISISGIMGGHEEINDLVIVPLHFARDVLSEYQGVSAIEINLQDTRQLGHFYAMAKEQLGPDFAVLSREEQNPTLYKVIRSEKWAIFAILTFTGFIAVLNIIGSLTMLVIDKRKDIAVLKGLGADKRLISRIFFFEGMLISLIGSVAGLVLGLVVCLSQIHFGWLKFGPAESMIVDVYPVAMRASDFLLVFVTVFSVSLFVSYLASRLSVRQNERLS